MSITLTLGVDVGNNTVKVWPQEGEPFMFPTYVDTVAVVNVWEKNTDPMEHLDMEILDSKEIPKGRALYGILATKTRNGKPMPVKSNKARSPQVARSMICALGAAVCRYLDSMKSKERRQVLSNRAPGEPLDVYINLGTGLPMDTWLNDDDRKAFRRTIRGTHVIQFCNTNRWAEYGPIRLNVEKVVVAAEGTAILYGEVFSEDGKSIKDMNLAKGLVAVADIGANTLDMPVYNQMKLDNTLSKPHDSQLAEQLDGLAQQIKVEYDRSLSRQALEECIFENDMCLPNGALEPISIRHLCEPRFRYLADVYASHIADVLESSNFKLTDVIMGGGGAVVVRPYLEDSLRTQLGTDKLPFRLHWPANAQLANAHGYLKIILDTLARKSKSAS